MEVENILVKENQLIKDALSILDKSGLGTIFVVDDSKKLIGLVTDGDVRRALLKSVSLDLSITNIMNREFVSLPIGSDNSTILKELNKKIKIIPLVDKEYKISDYASINRLRKIMIASPLLEGNELAYVSECIETNWISSQGKFVRQFESLFSDFHDDYHALAVSNGTVALHLALVALNVGKGDEVLIPNLTFAASINAVLYTGATPVLVDVEKDSWNIDITKVEKHISSKTKAIMPVHLYGQACDMDAVSNLAKKHDLLVIEDSAEALGSKFGDKYVGSFGDASTFSFFGNKTITTGEGGMVLFKDEEVAKRAATLRDHGMNKNKRYWHDEVGFNYRLTNLQAAVGVAQFEKLDKFVTAKRLLAKRYNDCLSQFPFLQTPIEKKNSYNSYWLYTFLVKSEAPFKREELMDYLNSHGIENRPVFYPLHVMPPYRDYGNKEDLKVSQEVSDIGMSLPSAVNLTELEQKYICDTIVDFIQSKL